MRVEKIDYVDYNGVARSDVFRFNLGRKELTKLNYMFKGGIQEKFNELSAAEDINGIIEIFETIISTALGRVSDDGKRFIRDKEYTEEFMDSAAYDTLYGKVLGDADYLNDFIRSIISPELLAEAEKTGAIPAEVTIDGVKEIAKVEAK